MRTVRAVALALLTVILGLFAAGLFKQAAGSHDGMTYADAVIVLLVAVAIVLTTPRRPRT
jgi:hypothetical protein